MPRPLRLAPGGLVYHVLNRGNARRRIFERNSDFQAFERALAEAQGRIPMRILAWCVMPNHWHLVLWPRLDGDLSRYMQSVTLMHAQRWHAHRASAGTGHLYQGRFKSFVVQHDAHFFALCRYVEANALRANLVRRAEEWRWCSLWRACSGNADQPPPLEPWPVARPGNWLEYVNLPAAPIETEAVRQCARRGVPYGEPAWAQGLAGALGLQCTLRPRGKPRKGPDPLFRSAEKGV
ncbi:MAG TPA: transposase [Burkholderiales bacterium]|nr:transposase [Burkholderiales bacterium]